VLAPGASEDREEAMSMTMVGRNRLPSRPGRKKYSAEDRRAGTLETTLWRKRSEMIWTSPWTSSKGSKAVEAWESVPVSLWGGTICGHEMSLVCLAWNHWCMTILFQDQTYLRNINRAAMLMFVCSLHTQVEVTCLG
jgi:hypothetical protein